MKMASRIKQVRELTGKRQAEVAAMLNITQQAYCGLEQSADNAKLETLRKFCRVMQIDIAYLVSEEIPITTKTLSKFGRKGCAELISSYEKLEKEAEILAASKEKQQQLN